MKAVKERLKVGLLLYPAIVLCFSCCSGDECQHGELRFCQCPLGESGGQRCYDGAWGGCEGCFNEDDPLDIKPNPMIEFPTMVHIESGQFDMGSPEDEANRQANENLHKVELTVPFSIAETEITQKQFEDAMGYNPGIFQQCGSECPVENVTWHEALAYADTLNRNSALPTCYICFGNPPDVECMLHPKYGRPQDCAGYRLPTEAEWEYAARGGSCTPYHDGSETPDDIGWCAANADGSPHPVAEKTPNDFGLYDVSGNVWEWVWDLVGQGYPANELSLDPCGMPTGGYRACRGGSWTNPGFFLRSAQRNANQPDIKNGFIGFRVVRSETVSEP